MVIRIALPRWHLPFTSQPMETMGINRPLVV